MSDEKGNERRMLVDGDGSGDDVRLNNLMKHVVKWTKQPSVDPVENAEMYTQLLVTINQVEMTGRRNKLLAATVKKETEFFKQKQVLVEKEIEQVSASINHNRMRLEEAKILKKSRMLYDVQALQIELLPDGSVLEKQFNLKKEKLKELEPKEAALDDKFESSKKQISTLISTAHHLLTLLEEDDVNKNEKVLLDDVTQNYSEPWSK